MRIAIRGLELVAVLVVSSSVTLAHHSSAEYDPAKPATKQGLVTKVEWQAPHVLIHFDVQNAQTGTIENWVCEMGPPHLARNSGWTTDTLKVGEAITVTGHLAKDGSLRIKFIQDRVKVADIGLRTAKD